MEYPVGKETLIIPEVSNDDYVTENELVAIQAMLKGREDLTETASGEDLKEQATKLLKQFSSVKASLEMEGLIVTKEMERIILAHATGQITFEEFTERAKELSKCESEK